MNYFPFIVLFHHILGTLLAIFSLKFSSTVIFYRKIIFKNAKISPVLTYFFIFTLIWSFSTLINKLYSIAFWRPIENEYNAIILYWIGFPPQMLGYIGTMVEIFLCIDRCASILFPIKYSVKYQKYFSYTTFCGLVIYTIIFLYLNDSLLFGLSVPTSTASSCLIYGCFLKNLPYLAWSEFSMVFVNVFGGCILFLLTKTKLKVGDQRIKRLSNTVLILIASSTISDLLPFLLAQYLATAHNIRLNAVIGPFATTFDSINITLSAWIYSKAFRETFKLSSSINNGVKVGAISIMSHR